MGIRRLARHLLRDQLALGPFLRFEALVPFTLGTWILTGFLLTLPPGPLCDEGMVLFMEGGCDYGLSNMFFFAKVSLLVTTHLGLLVSWLRPPARWRGFLPHFALLALLGWLHRQGGPCDTYYAQPNGSLGQMILEMAAFALLAIALGRATANAPWLWRLAALAGADLFHVGVFYAFLPMVPHWSWVHSALVSSALLLAAVAVWTGARRPALRPPNEERSEVAAGEELSGAERLSLFTMAATFGLIANPWGVAPTVVLAAAIGLAAATLLRPMKERRLARLLTAAGVFLLPTISLVVAMGHYDRQTRLARELLEQTGEITREDAARVAAAAREALGATGPARHADFAQGDEIRAVAQRALGNVKPHPGADLALFVQLEGTGYARIYWTPAGPSELTPSGNVFERLVSEHSELSGHAFIEALGAGSPRRVSSKGRYLFDRVLRQTWGDLHAGRVWDDEDGEVFAILVVRVAAFTGR